MAFNILTKGPKLQIAYKLRLLDRALIRSNSPDEVLSRRINGQDHFILPPSKVRHAQREKLDIFQRSIGLTETCRAQHQCSACPACWLFGTLGITKSNENRKNWSLTSRIDFTEAIALQPGVEVDVRTLNSVDPKTMATGTAGLTRDFGVPAGTEFYGTVTVEAGNEDLASIALHSLMMIDRVGARSTNLGLCSVEIIAIRKGYVESAAWSPMIVAETGKLPVSQLPIPTIAMDTPEGEETLRQLLVNFNQNVVQEGIKVLNGKVQDSAKDIKVVLEALAAAEADQPVAAAKLLKSLKAIKATLDEDEDADQLQAMLEAFTTASEQKKNPGAFLATLKDAAEALRTLLSSPVGAV